MSLDNIDHIFHIDIFFAYRMCRDGKWLVLPVVETHWDELWCS